MSCEHGRPQQGPCRLGGSQLVDTGLWTMEIAIWRLYLYRYMRVYVHVYGLVKFRSWREIWMYTTDHVKLLSLLWKWIEFCSWNTRLHRRCTCKSETLIRYVLQFSTLLGHTLPAPRPYTVRNRNIPVNYFKPLVSKTHRLTDCEIISYNTFVTSQDERDGHCKCIKYFLF